MLKIGVLGAGHLGKIHLKVLAASSVYSLIGFYDPNPEVKAVLFKSHGYKAFEIEMEIKQLMTLEPVNLFDNCLINVIQPVKKQINVPDEIEPMEEITEQHLEETELNDIHDIENIQLHEDKPESLEEKDVNQSIEEKPLEVDTKPINELDNLEFTVDLEKLDQESVVLKPHNDIYYERYKEARKRALIAKNIALQAFLEAKEIKHKYDLDDMDDESDEEFFNNKMEEMNDNEHYEES